jgi:hypothetical protein
MPEGEEKKKDTKKAIRDASRKGGDPTAETHGREFYDTIARRGDAKITDKPKKSAHGKRGR